MISPLASVNANAQIGAQCEIEAFSVIYDDVTIGKNTWIGPNVTIFPGSRIGSNVKIFPGAVIGAVPQDLKFQGEYSTAVVGDHVIIREYVTINRGTKASGTTSIGDHSLLMAYVHIAHDCAVGQHCILANQVTLAGHVKIESFATLEGLVAVQQHVKIGKYAFVAGASLVRKDVSPFIKVAREPLSYVGVNTIGMTRRGLKKKTIARIEEFYTNLFVHSDNFQEAIAKLQEEDQSEPEKKDILNFIKQSRLGIVQKLRTR